MGSAAYKRTAKGRYAKAKGAAKERRIPFDLTFAEYNWLVEDGECFYCSGELPPAGSALDRIDSNLGYDVENAVACCYACNTIKGNNLTALEMKAVAKMLKKMRGPKKPRRRVKAA